MFISEDNKKALPKKQSLVFSALLVELNFARVLINRV